MSTVNVVSSSVLSQAKKQYHHAAFNGSSVEQPVKCNPTHPRSTVSLLNFRDCRLSFDNGSFEGKLPLGFVSYIYVFVRNYNALI